jgi:hypothetical protein
VNYGIEHVDALGGGGSFDYGSLVDLGMGPLLILAYTSHGATIISLRWWLVSAPRPSFEE